MGRCSTGPRARASLTFQQHGSTCTVRGEMDNDHDSAAQAADGRQRARRGADGRRARSATGRFAAARYAPRRHAVCRARAAYPLSSRCVDVSGVTVDRLRYEEEQAYYNDLYLLAPVGYFVVGFDSTILQANLVGADMLGIARAKPDARTGLRSFISPGLPADFDAFFGRAAQQRARRYQCRLQLRHGAGELVHVDAAGQRRRQRPGLPGGGRTRRRQAGRARTQRGTLPPHRAQRRGGHLGNRRRTRAPPSSIRSMAAMLGYEHRGHAGPAAGLPSWTTKAAASSSATSRAASRASPSATNSSSCSKDGRDVWTTMATNPIFDAGRQLPGRAGAGDRHHRPQGLDRTDLAARPISMTLTGLPNRHMFMDRLRRRRARPTAAPASWRCCSSTSTTSRKSTTSTATRRGDLRAGGGGAPHRRAACARPTRWRGWAATSSPSSLPGWTTWAASSGSRRR